MWGEFGRTPRINKMNSRDHWPQANACVLAGGGMKTGQVIGETNRYGEVPVKRPVKFQEVFATLYHNLGLDAHRDRVFDGSGTPRYPVDPGIEPLHELIYAAFPLPSGARAPASAQLTDLHGRVVREIAAQRG